MYAQVRPSLGHMLGLKGLWETYARHAGLAARTAQRRVPWSRRVQGQARLRQLHLCCE